MVAVLEPRPNLFGREERERLFAEEPVQVSNGIASNRAYAETLVLGDPASYQARKDIQRTERVYDEAILRLNEGLKQQRLVDTGITDPDTPFDSPEQRLAAINQEILRLDQRTLDPTDVLLFQYMLSGGHNVPIEVFKKRALETDPASTDALRDSLNAQQRFRGRTIVDDLVASQGWDNYGEAIGEIIVQDFIPISNVLTRVGLNRKLLEAATNKPVDGWRGFFPGEIRQQIRTHLTNAGPEGFTESVQAMSDAVHELERDPILGPLLTKYAVLEAFEGIFEGTGVFEGAADKNTLDRWFGNLEIGLEGLFTVMTISRIGKGLRGSFRAPDAVRARQVARRTGERRTVAEMDEQIQSDALAVEFDLDPDEAVAALLPRPSAFVDDLDELPDGNKRTFVRSERQRSEILETTDSLTGRGLTPLDRTNAINQEIEKIDLSDGMHVQGKMNTLRMLENDNGFEITVTVGKTAEGGWDDLAEIVNEAVQVDSKLERFNIMFVDENGTLSPLFKDVDEFQRAAFKGEVPTSVANLQLGTDPQFYLQYKQQRFWHTADKATLSPGAFTNTGLFPRTLLAPNAKFGDEIYGTFLRAYMDEQLTIRNLESMFKPFYDLGIADKKFVASAYEWTEDFGKQSGRAPTIHEVVAKYDGITESQVDGVIALRQGYDTMHELFNRRLYRDWQALGYKSARPTNTTLPMFHGEELSRGSVPGGATQYLDPETGKMVNMSAADLDDMYNAGGRIMRLDMAIDAANDVRSKADLIIVREGVYEVGELSTRPLKYHPGYSMRFYDDPYFVIKNTEGVTLNGGRRAGPSSAISDAIRTAGTQFEADSFVKRAEAADRARGVDGTSYTVIRSNDISNTESTLLQKQAIHREGRLFWDERNFERLPDVNGNRAVLEDPVKSLERGIGMATRQLTHEDPLKSLKAAFENEFGDLLSPQAFKTKGLGQIVDDLRQTRRQLTDSKLKARYNKAIELVNYFRLLEGTETTLIPAMREAALSLATTISRATGGAVSSRRAEKFFQTMDPTRTMRSVAFHAFMVFRPVRQALLQSFQISYLAGLNPTYVASPQFFRDAFMLRRGIAKLRNEAFDDGYSIKRAAKAMGLSSKEYRKLIKEFDRSGLIDLVDVHSFAGGARRAQKLALPNSPVGTVGYKAKQFTTEVKDFFQKIGFNFGERNNLTFTYNLALRRLMEKNKFKSVLELRPKDWDQLRVDASDLALGMVRPNSFGYQTGALSVGTQFLSFGHKAMLGLLGQNPAIKGADAFRIAGGTYLLFGANMYGARDFVKEQLTIMGLEEWGDKTIPGLDGGTLVDLIAGGVVETMTNRLLNLTSDDYKDIDLAFIAPGVDFTRMWEMNLETLASQPIKGVFGPFGNIYSKTMQSYDFITWYHDGNPDQDPADKFMQAGQAIGMGLFPQYNDLVMSYMGYQMGLWYSASGEALPLRPTMNGLLARAAFGGRTKEELSYYRLQNKRWESDDFYKEVIKENKAHMIRLINLWRDGIITPDEVRLNVQILANLMEQFPEGRRQQVVEASLLEDLENGIPSVHKQLVEMMKKRQLTPDTAVLIDQFLDIPVEQREQLKQLAKEAWDTQLEVDTRTEEILREERQ